jgi:hypothetical protein
MRKCERFFFLRSEETPFSAFRFLDTHLFTTHDALYEIEMYVSLTNLWYLAGLLKPGCVLSMLAKPKILPNSLKLEIISLGRWGDGT